MRAVIQKVKKANVKVEQDVVGQIGSGLLVFLAVHKDDSEDKIDKMTDKIIKLRIFEDKEGKYNFSLKDMGAELLLVSQFTLYGNCQKGNRPSFLEAARPEKADPFCRQIEQSLQTKGVKVETGQFQAMMDVEMINDGPTTIILDV